VRQAAQLQSLDATTRGIFSGPGTPGGVQVTSITRLNDPVVDARARIEHARSALTDGAAATLSSIERLFPEPSDNGLAEQLNDFWNSWADVGNDPGSTAARAVVLPKAGTVATQLNTMSASLQTIAGTASDSLTAHVQSVNAAASQLADLNGKIAVATATGSNSNGLLDERDLLLDQLAKLAGGVATINPNGSADVTIGGATLVTGNTAAVMTTDASYAVKLGGNAVTLAGGSTAADVQALTVDIPNYQGRLDAVAAALANTVNSAQASGYDLSGQPGAAMFTGTTAATITMSLTSPAGIAASSTPGGNLDGSHAIALSQAGTSATGPDAVYQTLVGDLGAASGLAQQRQTTQDAITASVDSLRDSASGVSYDEEVTNMISHQQAFQASSRVLTTLDDMLDTLINHTGVVGRG
jgi:flagellar hook-associated protein 1 FlgK